MAYPSFVKNESGFYTIKGLADSFTVGCTGRCINDTEYERERAEIRKSEKKLLRGITGLHEKEYSP
jgi:hypothetical protein